MIKAIEVNDLFYTYSDGTKALQGLSLKIQKGDRVALLGPNGAGKSTLLLHLNGINLPQKGSVRVLGREVSKKTEFAARKNVGLVFQDPDDQVFSTSVWDDVAFGPLNMQMDKHELEHRVADALMAVGMWELRNKAPHHLSFGQKKRVAIAGVLAMEPEIMILDEPTAYLDPKGQEILMSILEGFSARGKTLVIATHDMDMAAEWANQIIIIKNGLTLAQGSRELLFDEQLLYEANLRLPLLARVFADWQGPKPRTVDEARKLLGKVSG